MFELIYCSIAIPEINTEHLDAILKRSRSFNLQNNITGCLLYHDNEFIQFLEGDKQTIQELYTSIKIDGRHSNVTLLAEDIKEKRLFKNWVMASPEMNDGKPESISKQLFLTNFMALSKFANRSTAAAGLFFYMAEQLLSE